MVFRYYFATSNLSWNSSAALKGSGDQGGRGVSAAGPRGQGSKGPTGPRAKLPGGQVANRGEGLVQQGQGKDAKVPRDPLATDVQHTKTIVERSRLRAPP